MTVYVLARHTGESLELLDGLIEVKVLSVTGKIVRLGISAPREVSVERQEVAERRRSGGSQDDRGG